MAISEESRHHLYQRLEQVLGSKEATVLMEHLPPVGWADVATKRDLDALDARMELRFERFNEVDRRFDAIDRRLEEFRSLLITLVGVMAVLFAATAGAIVAAVKI